MINIMDAIIILFLLLGMVIGFKRGAIQSIAVLVGTIGVIVLSVILKDPLGTFLYTHLPFFKFKVPILSVLIYRAIAFVFLLCLFSSILGIILKVTGVVSKVVDYSIVLTLPSKLIGIAIGFIESYVFLFIFLFIFSQFSFSNEILAGSKLTDTILSKTPFTVDIRNSYKAFNEISALGDTKAVKDANKKAIDILKDYELITEDDINTLSEKGKI